MSSSRRSQKLSLKDSLILLIISLRSKKPSAKADAASKVKADAARKVKADVATRIIINAVIKVNIADAVTKVNCFRNFKKHIINNFKAAKKTSETYIVKLQRRTNIIKRVKV